MATIASSTETFLQLPKDKFSYLATLPQKQQSSIKEEQKHNESVSTSKGVKPSDIGIDPRDVGTPDDWVPRHSDLVRLTGKHPFNSEAPLPMLMEHGFITPNPLHYVRNHGPVPKLNWDTHRLIVDGLVTKRLDFSMDDIVRMPYREFPVTLVCAGNRRKEQNMVKQTIGFNWGPSGVSTAVWRGVPLRHVLKLAGCSLDIDYEEPRHVCFVGADKLPNGDGLYGTSLTLEWSMNDAMDVLLAYEMNGERLAPDHGYPLRVIIPGVIGGRMVKWLTRITVTNKESDNHYHYHDNRVLPPNVDVERANKEKWWYVPDYIINEFNINSVISSPAHDEHIPLSSFKTNAEYTLKGYAYTGGGRKVIRVEITLDDGKTWLLTDQDFPETRHPIVLNRPHNPIRRHWCWCFWSINVPIYSLIRCPEIRVRAWDAGQNTQPENLTWNVMGMMNNCHFRVKIHTVAHGKEVALRFEHPTQPGNNPGGWMVKPPSTTVEPKKPMTSNVTSKKTFTMEQVQKYDNEKACWIVVDKKVYDCTKFLDDHPGGADSILINAGTDCTDEFNSIHSDKAKDMLVDYYIGDFVEEPATTTTPGSNPSITIPKSITPQPRANEDSLVALNPKVWLSCPLIKKIVLNHDTRIFRFALQSDKHSLGLPAGNHMFIRASISNQSIIRQYTPVTTPYSPPGYFDLLIKVYFKNVHPKYPNGGLMTQHLESLRIGDTIDVKGPLGSFIYFGRSQYQVKIGKDASLRNCKRIGMLAGGSGITPIYQVIQSVLNDPEDLTELYLIYANQTEKDILLRDELDELAKRNPRFKVYYTLDKPPNDWQFGSGFVTEEMIRKNLPPHSSDRQNIIIMCGPLPMIEYACIPNLKKIGFTENEYFKF